MGIQKEQKSPLGPALILVILLVDVGIIIMAWHFYQRRQERLDDAGLNFARAPEPDAAPAGAKPPPPTKEDGLSSIDRYVKKESLQPGRLGPPAAAPPPNAAAKAGLTPAASAQGMLKMDGAVNYFFQLKNSERFKNSKVVQAWKRDFLSYPDLKKLNDDWRKNHDPLSFMVGMVKSPNFQTMAGKYLGTPDMQAFVKNMATAPAVINSAGTFMADDSIKGAVGTLKLGPGGAAAPAMKDSSAQMGRLKANPALKGVLENGNAPPPAE